jgi:hypothetical protein
MEYLPVLQSIHSAIDKELKTIKRFGATSRISLFSGKKSQTGFPQKFLYRFEMLIQRILPDGSQCNLVVANKSVEAKVTATEGQFIWLEISTDFGKRITQAYYEVDLSFFLEDLKEKYASLIDSKIPINQIYSKSHQNIRVTKGDISASNEIKIIGRTKLPISTPGHPSAVGVHIILDFITDEIQFFEITSAIKGYGEKMVRAVMTAIPDDWEAAVVMDWSEGFWDRMVEKYDNILIL